MTQPVPEVFVLDQAVIDAGRELLTALTTNPTDLDAIAAAEEKLSAARAARGHV